MRTKKDKYTYTIRAKVWLYPGGTASWHFVSIPKKESADMKARYGVQKKGWGSLPVRATLGATEWRTSIFPDTQSGTYLLPLKADVRRKEDVGEGDTITCTLVVCPE